MGYHEFIHAIFFLMSSSMLFVFPVYIGNFLYGQFWYFLDGIWENFWNTWKDSSNYGNFGQFVAYRLTSHLRFVFANTVSETVCSRTHSCPVQNVVHVTKKIPTWGFSTSRNGLSSCSGSPISFVFHSGAVLLNLKVTPTITPLISDNAKSNLWSVRPRWVQTWCRRHRRQLGFLVCWVLRSSATLEKRLGGDG